jgi:hypothetical protein
MAFQLSPGVLVTEEDRTNIVPSVATSTGAIAGAFKWGPVDQVTVVESENNLVSTFGSPNDATAGYFFTAANFLSYGNNLNLVRVVDKSVARNAVSLTSGGVTSVTVTNNTELYSLGSNLTAIFAGPGNTGITARGNVVLASTGQISPLTVDNQGNGYVNVPRVVIEGNGTGATANAVISNGRVTGILLTSPGSGYSNIFGIYIDPQGGDTPSITAQASATILRRVSSVTITTPGTGYTTGPNVVISGNVYNSSTTRTSCTSVSSIRTTGQLITNDDVYREAFSLGNSLFGEFAAKYPGTLGNSVRISMADANTFATWLYSSAFGSAPGTSDSVRTRGGRNDEMHIVIVDATSEISGVAGLILEKYSYVSKSFDAKNSDNSTNYYVDVLNNQSSYVRWLRHPATGTNWGTASVNTVYANLTSNVTTTLSGGADGNQVSSGNLIAGYSLFSNDELYDVSLIPMGPITDISVIGSVVSLAENRRDCMVFISPPYVDVVNTTGQETKLVNFRNTLNINSSFAVMDSGWKYQYDRYNDKYRYVPLNGDIAGLAARTDYVADPWFSPAGYNRGVIKNVVKLAYSPSKTDRDILYKNGVNPVVTFPGQGTVLFGDKTLLARPGSFDRINVRRLFIILEKAIAAAAKFQLFEFNDPFTRAQFKNLVEPFLRDVQGRRGVTDFRVVCDDTNNTATVVDRNEFVADIFIKPARSINFIQLNFVATRSGISFEEVGA